MTKPTEKEMKNLSFDLSRILENYHRLYQALEDLTDEVQALMDDSDGVAGLHQNGDIASWSEICEGGQFPWLASHSEAEKVLKEIERQW